MTIEEIEAEFIMRRKDDLDGEFTVESWTHEAYATKYFEKLLAVAKAASPLREKTSYNKDSWTQVDELRQALEELEKA